MQSEPAFSLAQRLRERREQLGLSQAQAARELDVARTAYRLWEMEAARPAPDRWRLIAGWLGISVTTLLLAEELVSEEEAASGTIVEVDFGRRTGRTWDEAAATGAGDFFAQARSVITEGAREGYMTEEQGHDLLTVIERIEYEHRQRASEIWQPAELRKTVPADERAPRAAREAIAVVADGISEEARRTAQLLASELVTNSVVHGASGDGVAVSVSVDRIRVRVEVSEQAGAGRPVLTAPGEESGLGLTLVDELASRWGIQLDSGRNVVWFEIDLAAPGASSSAASEPTQPD